MFFEQVGLACKGWSLSGSAPPEEVCEEGETISIGGMRWTPKLDLLEVPVPQLHFSKKVRGRLSVGTEIFSGSFGDLEKFVPKNLTRTMIFSKNNALFDMYGKFVPVTAGMKLDIRAAVKMTQGWNDPVPEEIRSKWIKNFWNIEKLKGIKFERARMPSNAVSCEMDVIGAGDAAEYIKIVGVWARFRLKTGKYSCQLLIGRDLLAAEDSTIPKSELDVLTMTSNLLWIIRMALERWVTSYIAIGDSVITMCWVTSEKKRLSLYHRNRTVQIRRGIELDRLFHVISEENPADCGTRPAAVKDNHLGPDSAWEKGLEWMRGDIDDAISEGILTPVSQLRVKDEDEETYRDGFVFEKSQEILTRGHPCVLVSSRVEQVKMRAELANYIVSPSKFGFVKTVRITAIVFRFLRSFKCLQDKFRKKGSEKLDTKFQMFFTNPSIKSEAKNTKDTDQVCVFTPIVRVKDESMMMQVLKVYDDKYFDDFEDAIVNEDVIDVHRVSTDDFKLRKDGVVAVSQGVENPGRQFRGKAHVILTENDISRSLEYFFKIETKLVKQFNKPELLKKISVEKGDVLMSRSRIIDGQRFQEAGGLEDMNVFSEYNLKLMTPMIDRYSPLAYAVGDHVHTVLAKHSGYETSYRECLNYCFILQGLSLFREIGEDCTRCAIKRKKFIEASMGPISDEQLTVAPAFYITMADIFGPCQIFVPGHAMKTRHRNIVEAKCYVLVFCCPVTKLVNLQVIEEKSADGVIDGVNRLGCEVGFPSYLLIDKDSGMMKAFKEAQVELKNMEFVMQREHGIKFSTCPVSGHNFHGLVERKIRTVQDCLEESGFAKLKFHATGLQTTLKLIENDINNLPLGYSYGRDGDNSPILRLIFPNMLKVGRMNRRSLDGPIRLPKNPGELMKRIEKGYDMFFKLWNTAMIPKLMKQKKWFGGKVELTVGDIVYFQKVESEWSSKWTIGKIVEVVRSKDGVVRRALVQYQNSSEESPRTTERAVRSLIKIFNIDDENWQADMSKVEELMRSLKKDSTAIANNVVNDEKEVKKKRKTSSSKSKNQVEEKNPEAKLGDKLSAWLAKKKACKMCCCAPHCSLVEHVPSSSLAQMTVQQVDYKYMMDRSWLDREQYEEEVKVEPNYKDYFLNLICSVNTDLGYENNDYRAGSEED